MSRLGARILAAVLTLCVVGSAAANPRWWWHDRQFTFAAYDATHPDVAVIPGKPGSGERFFVAWEQADDSGATHIELTATFDGGCSWCRPFVLSAGPTDKRPAVAGARVPGGLRVVAAYESAGDIWVVSSSVIPLPWACSSFEAATWTTISAPLNADDPAPRSGRAVDLVAAGRRGGCVPYSASFIHFFAVWEDGRDPLKTDVWFARDTSGTGTAWETRFPLRDPAAPEGISYLAPSVAVDECVPAPGGAAAVNVVFAEAPSGRILVYRSQDSGLTFSSDGVLPGTPVAAPGEVAPAGANAFARNDTGFGECHGSVSEWHGVAWEASAAGSVLFDGEFHVSPFATAPGFSGAFETVASSLAARPALAVTQLRGLPLTAEAWVLFEGGAEPGELAYRPGILATDASLPNFETYPIPPERTLPPDPEGLTRPLLMTYCAWQEATGECLPERPLGAGDARQVAVARHSPHDPSEPALVMAVWSDSRNQDGGSGPRSLWFKRTDRKGRNTNFVMDPLPVPVCLSRTEAAVDLSFRLALGCPWDRIERYLIYRGAAARGPFPLRDELPAAGLDDPQGITLTGLVPGTTSWFVVIPEDEARNLQPARFDPRRADNDGFLVGQQLELPVAACREEVAVSCEVRGDACASDGRAPNGVFEPGEEVTYRLTFRNTGNLAADDLRAIVSATNATVLTPSVVIPSLPAVTGSASVDVRVRIDSTIACHTPLAVDLDVTGMRTVFGPLTPDADELADCDLVTAGASEPCTACEVPVCDLAAADLTYPPLTPPRTGSWVYTSACRRVDVAGPTGRIALVGAASGAGFDALVPGRSGALTLYQLECACSETIRLVKDATATRLMLFF